MTASNPPLSKLCAHCKTVRAQILRPKTHERLCKTCFTTVFESEIHATITTHTLFQRGSRVAIGASGGKDSTVLASVLKTLNTRYDYGVEFVLLSIDEGITGYRDDSLETVKRNAVQYGMELCILGYRELYGWSMDEVVAQIGKKGNCTYCGVFRRQALDRGAARLGITHVVTGHNADDIAETVVMNLLRGDLPRLQRCTSIVTESASSPIARSKPLKYAYEKEIVLYAHYKQLDYFTTECIYSPEAFRGSARSLIKSLERVRPSAILDIVRSGEAFAGMVAERPGGGGGSEQSAESGGGCGSGGGGRGAGGEMADMEKELVAAEAAKGLETEILMPGKRRKGLKGQQTPKVVKEQVMGNCRKCGYLTSQEFCQACALIEGLNKNRPRRMIEVDGEEVGLNGGVEGLSLR
ncbi:cytosolic thiouridylase subunit Ctu1 [Maublancomyces gigas]|uniref:Cytoplasmic tRNA 2-thiolation protein 1 n=1 Tax=Discina gigas TaxID=1032678 RepID=A0ABR3GAH0_9PEZI